MVLLSGVAEVLVLTFRRALFVADAQSPITKMV
jgi:hypothetical protein